MIGRTLATLLVAALGSSAAAQGTPNRNCTDDRGADRCSIEQQTRMRSLYGVPSIEEHAAAGEEVLRIFYVDGYGRDLVLVAFLRSPGRDPELRVYYPQPEGGVRPESQRAPVAQSVWREVAWRGMNFDRSFVPRPGAEPPICLHSWVYTVEAAERTRAGQPLRVRRKVEDACESGPAQTFAVDVQRLALGLIPHCAALDPRQHRNEAAMLGACRILSGDRVAAAEVLNRANGFQRIGGREDAHRMAGLFADRAHIEWAGELYSGSGREANEWWAARLQRENGWTNAYFDRVEGESAVRVTLSGSLSRPLGDSGLETASLRQIWGRDWNGDWRVERATVGPWQPFRR
jgi:hypothetical protein